MQLYVDIFNCLYCLVRVYTSAALIRYICQTWKWFWCGLEHKLFVLLQMHTWLMTG